MRQWNNTLFGSYQSRGIFEYGGSYWSDLSIMFPRRVVALGRPWEGSCLTQRMLNPCGGEVCRLPSDQAPWNQTSNTPVLAFTKVVTVMVMQSSGAVEGSRQKRPERCGEMHGRCSGRSSWVLRVSAGMLAAAPHDRVPGLMYSQHQRNPTISLDPDGCGIRQH